MMTLDISSTLEAPNAFRLRALTAVEAKPEFLRSSWLFLQVWTSELKNSRQGPLEAREISTVYIIALFQSHVTANIRVC